MAARPTRTRSTAERRRAEVVDAPVEAFGAHGFHGFHGAGTVAIARSAGISAAYLFRLSARSAGAFSARPVIDRER